MNYLHLKSRTIASLAIVGTLFVVTGCAEYTDRRESISPGFGNALASNTALQTVDPWPRYVERTHVHTDGTIAANAIDAYRAPAKDGSSGAETISLVPVPTQPEPKP